MTIRTRFAPSPTGFLHVGGARTALYCWLFARKHQGQFILRIEDTDHERSTQESTQAILDAMDWLGLDYDEGPYYQMQRLKRYQKVAEQLIAQGNAYQCYCSKQRLERIRAEQLANKQKPRYDGHCRNQQVNTDDSFVVRFKNPQEGSVVFKDCVHGEITVANTELDDVILLRSDGIPTYNFSVVVDDLDMKISHVIRGDDHINNTPRQINIYQALDVSPPIYAHVPMILGDDGKRLSKRHSAVSVMQYKEQGYLPDALLNYLVRLGWSHGDQEIFSCDEMIKLFDLTAVHKSPATFNPEKLLWLNQHYLRNTDSKLLETGLADQFQQKKIQTLGGPSLGEVIAVQLDRAQTLEEIADKSIYLYADVNKYAKEAADKYLVSDNVTVLKLLHEQLATITWNKDTIKQAIKGVVKKLGVKFPHVALPLRVAVTGDTQSPSIDITLQLIGQDRTLQRIKKAISYIEIQS